MLAAEARERIEELAQGELRLYEVVESRPGEGVVLQDARDRGAEPVRVVERTASRGLQAGDVLGCRLVGGDPWELSGAAYAFSGFELSVHEALDELEEKGEADPGGIGAVIVGCWLQRLVAPPPRVVDASGDPVTLVTDRYRILDRGALARAMAACPDVDENPEGGWVRVEATSLGVLGINPGKRPEVLELFAPTLPQADAGRAWFEAAAGDAVRFLAREIIDPWSLMERAGRGAAPVPAPGRREVSPDLRREAQRLAYRDWADQSVPALGGLTPREAAGTEAGRAKLVRLLRFYESNERRAARRSGEEPMDLGFLWEAVGLERPG